tara:strand:+ start:167 stop:565 length:399 start_codon:yes stop_codon:yes gene_type:complete
MEDDFYATLKLNSGEEIFARVAASEEEGRTLLVVHHPITINGIKGRSGLIGYKVEPWLKTTHEDMFIINMDKVITISESSDVEMIMMYQDYVRAADDKNPTNQSKINRRMGYLGSVNDTKELLEKIFKNSKN